MNAKLTLRMDDKLIAIAKEEAAMRGKSVSQMVGDFFDQLVRTQTSVQKTPPVTDSLRGVLKGVVVSEEDYKKHLQEKYG